MQRRSHTRSAAGVALAAALIYPVCASAQAGAAAAGQADDVAVLQVRENVFMLVGAGGNVTVQVEPPKTADVHDVSFNNEMGVLVVDPGSAAMSDKVIAAIRRLSSSTITYIINTGPDAAHVGANARLAGQGQSARGGEGGNGVRGAAILAQQNVLARLSGRGAPEENNPNAWPTDAFDENKRIRFNNEAIQILHEPAAHTDGDSIVFFRHSDVISAGDVFITTGYPVIDLARSGSLQGVIDALNRILDLAIPAHHEEGGTYIIPGHGRICDEFDVLEYRDMITIIRDRVRAMIKKGMTLEQVKAARPTRDYDPQYGATTGDWTTDMFVEAAYRSLAGAR